MGDHKKLCGTWATMPDLRVIGFDWKEGACGQDHLGLGWGLGLGNLSGDLGAG
jgi:hypothetical protein